MNTPPADHLTVAERARLVRYVDARGDAHAAREIGCSREAPARAARDDRTGPACARRIKGGVK